jgi:hypothetical protein
MREFFGRTEVLFRRRAACSRHELNLAISFTPDNYFRGKREMLDLRRAK